MKSVTFATEAEDDLSLEAKIVALATSDAFTPMLDRAGSYAGAVRYRNPFVAYREDRVAYYRAEVGVDAATFTFEAH